MKAAARVIYRADWETDRPMIMEKYGWEMCKSEVLISTPRRFGKTFSWVFAPRKEMRRVLTPPPHAPSLLHAARVRARIAIFCACLALSFGLEIVVFSEFALLNLESGRYSVWSLHLCVCVCVQAPLVARRASCSSGSSSLCAWRAASPRLSSTTRKPVVCTRSTARSRSFAAFRPLQRTKPLQSRSCALTQPLCVCRSKVGVRKKKRRKLEHTSGLVGRRRRSKCPPPRPSHFWGSASGASGMAAPCRLARMPEP